VALSRASPGPVLVGFAGALAAPEAVASLLSAGLRVAAFAQRGSHPALRRDRRVPIAEIAAPAQDAAAAVRELTALAHAIGAVALMPLDDASVWLCDRVACEAGLIVVGPTGARARLALDKRAQVRAALRAGFSVPQTTVCSTREQLLAIDAFPAILRPALAIEERGGRLVRGSGRVCADPGELRKAVATLAGGGPTLVQPWIRGTGEGLFGTAVDGEIVHPSAHRRLRMVNPQGSGSSACVSIAPDREIVQVGARMLREANWNGLFMLELLRGRDGTPWCVELNGRAWGSMALARRLGLEYPAWAAREVLGLGSAPASVSRPQAPVVCRHLGREIVHVMSVMRGPRSAALEDWPSRWGTVRAVARVSRGERWYNWSPRHPGVFVDDTVRTVLETLRAQLVR
jgi:predicted ATP-grasp superfamily ATP-dependent carboligase